MNLTYLFLNTLFYRKIPFFFVTLQSRVKRLNKQITHLTKKNILDNYEYVKSISFALHRFYRFE